MNEKITVPEAAERFGVDASTFYRYIRLGRILDPVTNEPIELVKRVIDPATGKRVREDWTLIPLTSDGKVRISGKHKPFWAEGHVQKTVRESREPVMLSTTRPVVSVAKAAKLLRTSTRMVRLRAAQGRIIEPDSGEPIPAVGKGGRYLIPLGDDGKPVMASYQRKK
jgi:hypothetical protein